MSAKPRKYAQLVVATLVFAALSAAGAGYDFPGQKPDRRIIKTQEKVDSLFEKGDYDRALFIYREELAPLGDKYAQYMVGFMCLSGRGTPSDVISASAWYRLAAERGDSHFVRARDELWQLLDVEQRVQSDLAYVELRKEFSDAILVVKFIEHDLSNLGRTFPETSYNITDGRFTEYTSTRAQAERDRELSESIRSRLNFLSEFFQSGQPYAREELARYEELRLRAERAIKDYESNN